MGGFNSGRRDGRPTIERTDSLRMDVNALMRPLRGMASNSVRRSTWTWSRDGKPFAHVATTVELDDETAMLWIEHPSIKQSTWSETGPQSYTVQLESTPCHLGGRRWWFVCPRLGRRCGKLYLPNGGKRFWSRQAYGLAYDVTREGAMDRAHRRIAHLRAKLGEGYRVAGLPPPKRPKGMRQRTYNANLAQLDIAEARLDEAFAIGALRILRREGRWPPE